MKIEVRETCRWENDRKFFIDYTLYFNDEELTRGSLSSKTPITVYERNQEFALIIKTTLDHKFPEIEGN